jgi:hypothetical protein
MKPTLVFLVKIKTILFLIFIPHVLPAQSVAWQRANDMGKGIIGKEQKKKTEEITSS